ncbi:high choriolytic enzyme 1-like protein [Lates japonicus]|uniref:High choriolytic enzyme 1-like protein n=1 Tax=Lates japonicus TaxID=270547 RepID=A0AAD3R4X5_LATJO|nr:high choriolytic enzyme 1-like protein [Lates japonicus]
MCRVPSRPESSMDVMDLFTMEQLPLHGIIQHEINPRLGFQHETRSDRYYAIKINWERTSPGQMAWQLYRQSTNKFNTPYDYPPSCTRKNSLSIQ